MKQKEFKIFLFNQILYFINGINLVKYQIMIKNQKIVIKYFQKMNKIKMIVNLL